jgi:NAD(P)-dependent dehydrogenase (short-subunit alcohol dehydrogenase family)
MENEMARSIVVTGGFGALGHAVSSRFLDAGDRVARIDFVSAASVPLAGALDVGGVNLTDIAATQAALDTVIAAHGGIDVLINIAGGFAYQTVLDGDLATWTRMFDTNLLSAVTITKLSLPSLLASASGSVIFVGAGAALKAGAGMGSYAASKSGVHRLTESLADELSATRVTVNAILPSTIDTPANRKDMPDADFKQWVTPQAIAEVAAMLASPAARAISGALLPVTRGDIAGE